MGKVHDVVTKIGDIEYPPIMDYETYISMKESCHSFSVNSIDAEKWDERFERERWMEEKFDSLKSELLRAIDERSSR